MNGLITITISKAQLDSVIGAVREMGEAISEDWLPGCDDHVAWALFELERALDAAAREEGYLPRATALGGRLHEAETRNARLEAENGKLRNTLERLTHGMELLEEKVEGAVEEVA